MLTVQDVERALPTQLKTKVSQTLVDTLNNLHSDPTVAELIRDNYITYTSVLRDGTFKMEDYLNAVAYVSFKMMMHTNKDAYAKTFPNRYQTMVAAGKTEKDISAYVAAYNGNKLVNLILEQTLIPVWILNQENYQKAINTQVELMTHSQSDLVRTQAANSLLTHLKKPESKKVELDLNIKPQSDGINELRDSVTKLVDQQKELIRLGVSTRQIIHADVIDVEAEQV